jgi:hypothetical protein
MRSSRLAALLAASALTLSLAGCFGNPVESIVEGVIENQTGVDVDAGTQGTPASLPDGWPGLPVPEGTITSSLAAESTFALDMVVDSPDAIEATVAELIAQGYTETTRSDLAELQAVVLVSPEWTATFTWLLDPETQKYFVVYGVSATDG